jgi:hypothetical protein
MVMEAKLGTGLTSAQLLAKVIRQHLEALPHSMPVPAGPGVGTYSNNLKMCRVDTRCLLPGPPVTVGDVAEAAQVLENLLASVIAQ